MISWKDINDGALGFEHLATRYVEEKFRFPNGNWQPTKETRDGNKDAYTVIIGFHPGVDKDETWWMEAKYSTAEKRKYLTRFRLDATIVSSIFHKRVTKIIFVTNIDIYAKTISEIQFALQKAIGCDDVFFCTKDTLEYWLIQNPDIYSDFFDCPLSVSASELSLFVSEEASLYPYAGQRNYHERCNYVYLNREYSVYFKVVSPVKQTISIEPSRAGIHLEARELHLEIGENSLCVGIKLGDNYDPFQISADGRQSRHLDLMKLNHSTILLLHKPINVLKRPEFQLEIQSQKDSINSLAKQLDQFKCTGNMTLSVVHGESGTGKSFIVHKLLQSHSIRNEYVFHCCFSEDHLENCKLLLQMACFLVYPYMVYEEIDATYLRKIGQTSDVPKSLIKLVSHRNNLAALEKELMRYCEGRNSLLQPQGEMNLRFLFLDNVQKLDKNSGKFLYSIMHELYQKNYPCFFVLAGQSYFLESSFYLELKQKLPINTYPCVLEEQDVLENIYKLIPRKIDLSSRILISYFPNLVILLEFFKFVQLNTNSAITSLNDFLICYYTFVNSDLGEALILEQFSNVNVNEEMRNLCMAVYTSPNGISIPENNATVNSLLQTGLVKLDEKNLLVPFHDIYVGIYRKANRISKHSLGIPYIDDLDKARDTVLFSSSPEELAEIADRITKMRKDGKFHSVYYILDSFFQDAQSSAAISMLKSREEGATYYQMYFDYAYAAINCSRRYTGYDYFEKMYNEIKACTSTKMRLLKLELLFELMNSNYNISHYKQAMQNYNAFQTLIRILARSGSIDSNKTKCTMYVMCESMRIQIQSSRGKRKSERMFLRWREVLIAEGYLNLYIDFCLRYAHTLYTVDLSRAYQYTEDAFNCLPRQNAQGSKLWHLATFQYQYLTILCTRDFSKLQSLEALVDSAQNNYYSNYRHRNLALCALLYYVGDIAKADERFLKDMANPRRLRERLKGFYYEILALHNLFHGNQQEALAALCQASIVFKDVPSYLLPVQHNRKVLTRNKFSPKRVDFFKGGKLLADWYYIDPRVD